MRKYARLRRLIGMIIFVICVCCPTAFPMQEQEQLNQRLGAIRGQKREIGKWAEWEKLESQCLELIRDHNSPAEKGKIYATIALIYSEAGWHSSEDVRIPKALQYTKKALEYPLEPITACKMYGGRADCLMVGYYRRTEDELVKIRREAIAPCLTGLKLALDNKAPKDHPGSPPRVDIYHVNSESPYYEELMNKHKQQVAERKKWERESELYFQRWALTQRCVTLYSRKPYDTDELRNFTQRILEKHEGVVNELIAGVEARIAALEAVSSKKPAKEPDKEGPPANSTQR